LEDTWDENPREKNWKKRGRLIEAKVPRAKRLGELGEKSVWL